LSHNLNRLLIMEKNLNNELLFSTQPTVMQPFEPIGKWPFFDYGGALAYAKYDDPTWKSVGAGNARPPKIPIIKPSLTDGLGCFPGVAAADCTHDKVVTYINGRYANGDMFKWLNIVLGNVKNALRGTYHAMSERHLPRYLAEFCYRFNRRFRLDAMIEQLASAALTTSPIPQRLLKLAEVRW